MCDLFRLIFALLVDLFRSRAALEAEVLVLRQQMVVLRRGKPRRLALLIANRVVLGWIPFPKTRNALAIVRPDTVLRWHRPDENSSPYGNQTDVIVAASAKTSPYASCPRTAAVMDGKVVFVGQ